MQLPTKYWVMIWVAIVSAVILSIWLTPAPDEEELAQDMPGHVELEASVDHSDGVLTIRNEGQFDWDDTTLELNPPSDYIHDPGYIRSGETVTVSVREFMDDGERFDPSDERPAELTIDTETEAGTGIWRGSL